jgi:hypothetical protein
MGVTYGNGIFVAVAYDGTIAVSRDGGVWQTNAPAGAIPWLSVQYAAGKFMALGGAPDTLISSIDGTNWVDEQLPDIGASPRALAAADDMFWLCDISIVDQTRSVYISGTGTNWVWAAYESFSGGLGAYYSVAFGEGVYVCVGFDTSFLGPNPGVAAPTIKISKDRTTWITEWTGLFSTDQTRDGTALRHVTYGEGLFVAVGNNNHAYPNNGGENIWCSRDGTNWSYEITSFPDLKSIAFGDGAFVAVGGYGIGLPGTIVTSTDGNLWTAAAIPSTNYLTDVAYGLNTFVAVGDYGQIFQSDPVITLRAEGQPGHVLIRGPVGQTCTIEGSETVDQPSSWQPLGMIQITNNPQPWNDSSAAPTTTRFYRARLGGP